MSRIESAQDKDGDGDGDGDGKITITSGSDSMGGELNQIYGIYFGPGVRSRNS